MARTRIPVVAVNDNGQRITPVAADIANGNAVLLDQNTVIFGQNAHATLPRTITIRNAQKPAGSAPDKVLSLPAGAVGMIGKLRPEIYGFDDGDAMTVHIDAQTTDIRFAAVSVE